MALTGHESTCLERKVRAWTQRRAASPTAPGAEAFMMGVISVALLGRGVVPAAETSRLHRRSACLLALTKQARFCCVSLIEHDKINIRSDRAATLQASATLKQAHYAENYY